MHSEPIKQETWQSRVVPVLKASLKNSLQSKAKPSFSTLKKPGVLATLSIICFVFFIFSMIFTYGPVVGVELKYQYKKTLHSLFNVTDLRSLILPTVNLEIITAQNQKFGMEIPALYIDEPIIYNVDPHDKTQYMAALKQGIAHAAGTDLPGYPGLGYYFAHSSEPDLRNQYNAIFYLLGKLQNNDQVFIWKDGEKYEYRVYDKKVVSPADLSFLSQRYDRPTIVLQTCWPPGTTNMRMLVFAVQK
jgi:LPXTG-site transpeptidase (sortase) family protein